MAHLDTRQDTFPEREPALADHLHRRGGAVDCGYGKRYAGQCLVYRRLRKYQEPHRCEQSETMDTVECADDVCGVCRQDGRVKRL